MRRLAVIAGLAVAVALAGCVTVNAPTRDATPAGPADPKTSSTAPDSSRVIVPDVLNSLSQYSWAATYEDNPDMAAAELKAYVTGVIVGAGLKPDVGLQAVTLDDSQQPPPGTVVARGTVVRVRIGFGD